MKKSVLILMLILLLSNSVIAADVAYILNVPKNANKDVLSVFNELNLSVELIKDSNVRTTDLSKYKLIFVDDAILRNTANYITISNYPSVIMNRYYGFKFGLTDYDGISQLASTAPLSVKKEGSVIQVYTQAKASSANLPYYYLANENKAPGMQRVAATYTGNSYDLGDVISYANEGVRLANNKVTQGKMCYFGIAKTKYWTPAARQMFKDCIAFVAFNIECSTNEECDDSNEHTEDVCEEPGTFDSHCEHYPIECLNDEECGIDGFIGNKFCQNDNSYRNFKDFTCNSPGTSESFCSNETEARLVEECPDLCVEGNCVSVACHNDAECNDSDLHTFDKCHNPGEFDSFCTNEPIACISNAECDDQDSHTLDTCHNPGLPSSFCTNEDMTCLSDSDCGNDGFIGEFFCSANNVKRNFVDYTCVNPGKINSSCASNMSQQLIQDCNGLVCVEGACASITCHNNSDCGDGNIYTDDICHKPGTPQSFCTHGEISCFTNFDCGSNRFIGNLYCQADDVFRDFLNYTCINKGTTSSYCSTNSSALLIDNCEFDCANGNCIRCNDNSECDDGDNYTQDICYFSGTPESFCAHDHIECFTDSECGQDSFIGLPFCVGGDVHQNFRTFECVNKGGPGSYCDFDLNATFIEHCPFGCFAGFCLPGVHDVALIDFANSIGGIRLEFTNGTDILQNPAQLFCNQKYIVSIKAKNNGDFYENVTFNGLVDGLPPFHHSSIDNFAPGDETPPKERTVNFTLTEGNYNVSVEAVIPLDENPLNNFAQRNIQIICPECFVNEDCPDDIIGGNYCMNNDVYYNITNFSCLNWECANETSSFLGEDCGNDHCGSWGNNYCKGNDVYHNRSCIDRGCNSGSCFANGFLQEELVEECADLCVQGECVDICDYFLTEFYNGFSSNLVIFPDGGNENSSTKIKLPKESEILDAEVQLTGLPVPLSGEKEIDVVLINDVSGSMGQANKLDALKDAANEFVDIVLFPSSNNQIGLVAYNEEVDSFIGLTNNKATLHSEINSYDADDGTCISCGIDKATDILSGSVKEDKVMILLSDGGANVCIDDEEGGWPPWNCGETAAENEALEKAQEAADAGITIHTIAFEMGDYNTELMEDIADIGNGDFYLASAVNLTEVYETIALTLLQQYPTNPFLDIGDKGANEWAYSGSFEITNIVNGFESGLESLLTNCNCPGCSLVGDDCTVNFLLSSDTAGKILADDLFIHYQTECI